MLSSYIVATINHFYPAINLFFADQIGVRVYARYVRIIHYALNEHAHVHSIYTDIAMYLNMLVVVNCRPLLLNHSSVCVCVLL